MGRSLPTSPLFPHPPERLPEIPTVKLDRWRPWLRLLALGACIALSACNRAAVRMPGASNAFPPTHTGWKAKVSGTEVLTVATPVDTRSAHYVDEVANSWWNGCRTDALWEETASGIVEERLRDEIAVSNLYKLADPGSPQSSPLVLKTEIQAFCSQAVGAVFIRVAGITAIKFSLERDGHVVWTRKIERVVTDGDPEYSGGMVGFLEQAMRVTMSDSLRMTFIDLLKSLESDLPQPDRPTS